MSRSFRRLPYAAWCGGSQKKAKRSCNRIMRRWNRMALLLHLENAVFIRVPEAMDVWAMPQDGPRHYRPYREGDDWMRWYRWVKAK